MGLLSEGVPLSWEETKKLANHVRHHGIEQFINIYHREKDRSDAIKWGDEMEYMIVKFDEAGRMARLSLRAAEILRELNAKENANPDGVDCLWRPEYAAYMIEGTPGKPFGDRIADLNSLEPNMRLRQIELKGLLLADECVLSIANFPRLGTPGFTDPIWRPTPNDQMSASKSLYFPDEAIYPGHPRFKTLTRNIRMRRGEKVNIQLKVFKDDATVLPIDGCPIDQPDIIQMDAMGFGMGCCCLQMTIQAMNLLVARHLYDQLIPICPIMLALTAASPIYRGYLTETDCRWNVISASVDCRTSVERGSDQNQNQNNNNNNNNSSNNNGGGSNINIVKNGTDGSGGIVENNNGNNGTDGFGGIVESNNQNYGSGGIVENNNGTDGTDGSGGIVESNNKNDGSGGIVENNNKNDGSGGIVESNNKNDGSGGIVESNNGTDGTDGSGGIVESNNKNDGSGGIVENNNKNDGSGGIVESNNKNDGSGGIVESNNGTDGTDGSGGIVENNNQNYGSGGIVESNNGTDGTDGSGGIVESNNKNDGSGGIVENNNKNDGSGGIVESNNKNDGSGGIVESNNGTDGTDGSGGIVESNNKNDGSGGIVENNNKNDGSGGIVESNNKNDGSGGIVESNNGTDGTDGSGGIVENNNQNYGSGGIVESNNGTDGTDGSGGIVGNNNKKNGIDETNSEIGANNSNAAANKIFRISKSRYDSVDSYLSPAGERYNDINLVYDQMVYDRLRHQGVDHLIAQHIAHLFIRDTVSLFSEKVNQNDQIDTDHFENIQSTNWQTMRFKPPPPPPPPPATTSPIGWRVEFRPCEMQITVFENAAIVCFIQLLARLIISESSSPAAAGGAGGAGGAATSQQIKPNFLIPISKVDENMQIAQKLNACRVAKFWFAGNGGQNGDDAYELMTIDEIINGKKAQSQPIAFPGLISLIRDFLNSMEIDGQTQSTIDRYLRFIEKRANGELPTTAAWIRQEVRNHPDYKHDSIVSERINFDLLKKIHQIQEGELSGGGGGGGGGDIGKNGGDSVGRGAEGSRGYAAIGNEANGGGENDDGDGGRRPNQGAVTNQSNAKHCNGNN